MSDAFVCPPARSTHPRPQPRGAAYAQGADADERAVGQRAQGPAAMLAMLQRLTSLEPVPHAPIRGTGPATAVLHAPPARITDSTSNLYWLRVSGVIAGMFGQPLRRDDRGKIRMPARFPNCSVTVGRTANSSFLVSDFECLRKSWVWSTNSEAPLQNSFPWHDSRRNNVQ